MAESKSVTGWTVKTINLQMDSGDQAVWNHKLRMAESHWGLTVSEDVIQLDMDTHKKLDR